MVQLVVIVHLLIAAFMIGLILLQKTEGGAAGAGFSASSSVESMMRPRARANPIGRATAILGLCFFGTSIALALLSRPANHAAMSIMSEPAQGPMVPKVDDRPAAAPSVPAPSATPEAPSLPAVPNK